MPGSSQVAVQLGEGVWGSAAPWAHVAGPGLGRGADPALFWVGPTAAPPRWGGEGGPTGAPQLVGMHSTAAAGRCGKSAAPVEGCTTFVLFFCGYLNGNFVRVMPQPPSPDAAPW